MIALAYNNSEGDAQQFLNRVWVVLVLDAKKHEFLGCNEKER